MHSKSTRYAGYVTKTGKGSIKVSIELFESEIYNEIDVEVRRETMDYCVFFYIRLRVVRTEAILREMRS